MTIADQEGRIRDMGYKCTSERVIISSLGLEGKRCPTPSVPLVQLSLEKELAYSSITSMLKRSLLSDLYHQWLYHRHQNCGLDLEEDYRNG